MREGLWLFCFRVLKRPDVTGDSGNRIAICIRMGGGGRYEWMFVFGMWREYIGREREGVGEGKFKQ